MESHLFKTERGVKILYITESAEGTNPPGNDGNVQEELNARHIFEVDKDFLFRNLIKPDKYEFLETLTFKNDAKELEKRLKILKPDILLSDTTLNLNECLYVNKNNEDMGIIDIEGFACFFYLGISKKELKKYFTLLYFIDQVKSIKNSLDLK